jgi:hypothetical protein
MSWLRSFSCRAAIIAVFFSAAVSHATVVTFNFQGNVAYIWDPDSLVGATGIQIGSPVQTSLRFDTATPDFPLYADDPSRGSFTGPGWLKVSIAGVNFEQTSGVQVDILHGANGGEEVFDAMADYGATPSSPELPTYFQTYLGLWETGPPYDLLSNAELPTSLDFSRTDQSHAVINANNYQIVFSVAQVPEPSTWALATVAVLLRALHGRRD